MRVFGEGGDRQLDRRLRDLRQEPSEELVDAIAARVGARRPRAWSRVAFAAALATFVLGSFASFGGVGYAASGAKHTLQAVVRTTHIQTSAAKQYKSKQKPHVAVRHTAAAQASAPKSAAETLPFTGVSLAWTVAAGLALLLLGLALRRRELRRR